MTSDVSRRDFMKAAIGTAGMAAAATLASTAVAHADEEAAGDTAPAYEGKKMFAGIPASRVVTDDTIYVGSSDYRIQLFENVYPIPRGVAYNSYVILDDKTVLVDTVDRSVTGQFFENVTQALDGRDLDYLIVNHMEPDHSSAIAQVIERWPNVTIVCTAQAAQMMQQFFDFDAASRAMIVEEMDTLNTGNHDLVFVMAPMVHWPEVMMTFDATTGTLFSADAFGSFGALNGNLFADEVNFESEWLPDARRYYCNIVGKYGQYVQDVLAKAGTIDIKRFCATHGPVWREDLAWIIDKYDKWSTYTPEDNAVMIVYGSIYGGTESAAKLIGERLSENGIRNVAVYDVSKTHVSELIAETFRCSHIILASATYNAGIFTPMKNFLQDLVAHNMQNRSYALVQNGSWSPASAELMKEILDEMPNMTQVCDPVTILSSPGPDDRDALLALADAVTASLNGEGPVAAAPAEGEEAAEGEEEHEHEEVAPGVWKCTVCGYIYDGEGEPPADFKCPVCGVGMDKFEFVEE